MPLGLAILGTVLVSAALALGFDHYRWPAWMAILAGGLAPGALVDPAAVGGLALHVGNEASLAARTVAEVVPGRPGPLAQNNAR